MGIMVDTSFLNTKALLCVLAPLPLTCSRPKPVDSKPKLKRSQSFGVSSASIIFFPPPTPLTLSLCLSRPTYSKALFKPTHSNGNSQLSQYLFSSFSSSYLSTLFSLNTFSKSQTNTSKSTVIILKTVVTLCTYLSHWLYFSPLSFLSSPPLPPLQIFLNFKFFCSLLTPLYYPLAF